MTATPLIGLPGRRKSASQIEGFPESLGHFEIDMYLANYASAVLRAGGLPVHLPLAVDPARFLPHLDGLVLTGGPDVDPVRYCSVNEASDVDEQRDRIEFALLEGAMDIDLPVLGVCRGLQLLNVHAGGSLRQDVPVHARYDVAPTARVHGVEMDPDSRLHAMYGPSLRVNSLHHQTVHEVGSGLRVAARADDGTVEGLELDGRDVVAVQWHPEMMDGVEPAFSWLVERAKVFRDARGNRR